MRKKAKFALCLIILSSAGCETPYEEEHSHLAEHSSIEIWESWEYRDPVTDDITIGVSSRYMQNITPLGSPYDDLQAMIGFICHSTETAALFGEVSNAHTYILFSMDADLFTETAYSRLDEGNILTHTMRGLVSDKKLFSLEPIGDLYESMPNGLLWHLPKGKSWMVRVKWNGGDATFQYDLEGLKEAVSAAGCPEKVAL